MCFWVNIYEIYKQFLSENCFRINPKPFVQCNCTLPPGITRKSSNERLLRQHNVTSDDLGQIQAIDTSMSIINDCLFLGIKLQKQQQQHL